MRPIRANRAATAALAVAVLATGGACRGTPTAPTGTLSDLAAARTLWRAAGVTDYTFTIARSCFCDQAVTRPVTIVVRHGSPAGIFYSDALLGTPDTTLFRQYLTIDRYFAFLEDVAGQAAGMTAKFDASLGFPVFVSVDMWAQMADDEFSVRTRSFVRHAP